MSFARAEELKRDLTNKFVVVHDEVAELKRFQGLTGKVKTVNMSCRALVEFDGPVDIGWYDIDPAYLTVVDAPLPKKKADSAHEAPKKAAAPAKPAAGGKSPLELARSQGAAGAAPAGEKKLSPLEIARQQGAAGAGEGKAASPLEMARQQGAASAGGAAAAATGGGEKKLSPLELARQQGAVKAEQAAAATPPAPPEPEPVAEAPAAAPSPSAAPSSTQETPGSTAEIIALARQQGAFKG